MDDYLQTMIKWQNAISDHNKRIPTFWDILNNGIFIIHIWQFNNNILGSLQNKEIFIFLPHYNIKNTKN